MTTLKNFSFKFSDYQISDVYNPSKLRGGRLNVTTIGAWNQYRGFQLTTEQTKIERRRNLGGLTFLSVMTVRVHVILL